MVAVRRRNSAFGAPSFKISRPVSPEPLTCTAEVKMGDGRHSPTHWMSHYPASTPFRSPGKPTFSFDHVPISTVSWESPKNNWWRKLFLLCSALSCFFSGICLLDTRKLASAMQLELQELSASMEKSEASRSHAQKVLSEIKAKRNKLHEANEQLQHEVKIIETLEEDGVDVYLPGGDAGIEEWIQRREQGLREHWLGLRQYLQRQSRQAIIDRYGSGPYRVQVTVQIRSDHEPDSIYRKFVLEMAPLEYVPHSVYFFLDMVEKRLWDDTIFLHHENVEHIVAAVPLDYKSQNIKHSALQQLELQTLAFPEYSDAYPHRKYTLGFASTGPTFYINTADNVETHGPGGQDHHQLPEDADPCFARVIAGTDVVDSLVKYGYLTENKVDPKGDHPWVEGEHAWSRIVSMDIMPPFTKYHPVI